MMKVVVFSALTLFTACTLTFAADTHCSNSQGSFRIVSEGYQGGAAPAPGSIIGYRQLSFYNHILEEDIIREGEGGPDFEVVAEFDPASYVVVKDDDSIPPRLGQRLIYAQDVHIYRQDGQELLPDVTELKTTLICTQSQFFFR